MRCTLTRDETLSGGLYSCLLIFRSHEPEFLMTKHVISVVKRESFKFQGRKALSGLARYFDMLGLYVR